MNGPVQSIVGAGIGGLRVDIECSLSNNLPNIVIVGSAAKSVDEAKERIRGAFTASNLSLPRKRITLNLAPADIPKSDSGLDLAMAVAILVASQQVRLPDEPKVIFLGELGLTGDVRPIRGLIGKLLAGRELGITTYYLPRANEAQAQLVPGLNVYLVENLQQIYDHLADIQPLELIQTRGFIPEVAQAPSEEQPLRDIVGQAIAKRALEIAAAGGHNVFFNGPPGTGKTMLAKALPSLLPPLSHEEILEVTHLHSLISHDYDKTVSARPFRSPHHSASHVAVIGGGHNLRPGEISLSHRGILFLDELPEFGRLTIESLRQPLEDRVVTVARAKDSVDYPANFMLVATANPCPCGYYGTNKPCSCMPAQISRYQQKLSGPIMDRIDLYTNVHEVDHAKLLHDSTADTESQRAIDRILAARAVQSRRNGPTRLNASLTNAELKKAAQLSQEAKTILDTAAERLGISARSYMRCVKVARTIADLDSSDTIETQHITEALQYRRPDQRAVML